MLYVSFIFSTGYADYKEKCEERDSFSDVPALAWPESPGFGLA
jgi:hypothetical protein